jgi:hypothetical protein
MEEKDKKTKEKPIPFDSKKKEYEGLNEAQIDHLKRMEEAEK